MSGKSVSVGLLIDGYNLLNAVDVPAAKEGPTPLHRARLGLLRFLEKSLDERVRRRTVIVFDAADAPLRLPARQRLGEMLIRFARDHESADALIEEMLEQETQTKRLLVVSSDHRVHRAARRCGAKSIDSDLWFKSVKLARRNSVPKEDKPKALPTPSEVRYWMERFAD